MKTLAAVGLLFLSGCRDRSQTDEPAPKCDATLAAARDKLVASGVQDIALRTELMIAACEGDRWEPRVLRCLQAASDQRSLDRCLSQLTHEQFVRLSGSLAPLAGPPVDAAVAAMIDAGIAVDAPPAITVPVDAATDAAAATVDAAIATRPRPRRVDAAPAAPTPPSPPTLDCSRRVVDPSDVGCVKQYCAANPQDPRCDIEP